ncbi:MAG: biotin operon repressor [Clostridium sp.]|jgi:biotin operon repressor
MRVEFLKDFNVRMKKVGAYVLLCKNSMFKNTWKNYGFEETHEYINLIFAVMLYIMEESLKDEYCTMDSIGSFIDDINMKYFKKSLSYEQCKDLGEFIVNIVLCDEGKAMYFKGFDFKEGEYDDIYISFVSNKIVYVDDVVKRTSYYLTDDGYSLLLSTLEIESNMKLTIHEMIFKLHLEKASYDKAVDDIKNIFNLLRIQLQKMHDAIRRIRQNALNYSVDEYKQLLEGNMDSLNATRKKFNEYRVMVNLRIQEIKEQGINIKKLNDKELENLKFLGIIEQYLGRAIEEQQKILNSHFDFKSVYSKELEEMASMSLIKRFNIGTDIYDKITADSSKLGSIDYILRPLYRSPINKKYNLNKCLQYQKPIKAKELEEDELVSFEEGHWIQEKREKAKIKLTKYKSSLKVILEFASEKGKISLKEISQKVKEDQNTREVLIPTVEIFREIIIELLKYNHVDISELKKEKEETISVKEKFEFELNETILNLVADHIEFRDIKYIYISKVLNSAEKIKFYGLPSDNGIVKTVICSDVTFKVER